jgi:hypothetical protein
MRKKINVSINIFSTLPSKKDEFWQFVLIPTIAILSSGIKKEEYAAVNFEWLFWSVTIVFENGNNK